MATQRKNAELDAGSSPSDAGGFASTDLQNKFFQDAFTRADFYPDAQRLTRMFGASNEDKSASLEFSDPYEK